MFTEMRSMVACVDNISPKKNKKNTSVSTCIMVSYIRKRISTQKLGINNLQILGNAVEYKILSTMTGRNSSM